MPEKPETVLHCQMHKLNTTGEWVVIIWNRNGESDDLLRGVVNRKNYKNFEQSVKLFWADNEKAKAFTLKRFFRINPQSLASQIPGVHEKAVHPVTKAEREIFQIIMNLNDIHKWEREQIADWLETLDNLPKFKANNVI